MPTSLWPFPKLTSASALSFLQLQMLQMLLEGCAVAVAGIFWLLQGITNPITPVLFTFIIWNCIWLAVLLAAPVIKQKSPWDWVAYLGVLHGKSGPRAGRRGSQLASARLAGHESGMDIRP